MERRHDNPCEGPHLRSLRLRRTLPKSGQSPGQPRSAFTLLEVLVVVAIIALLMAVLLPSLKAARDQSRRALCLSNLKELHLGWTVYLETYKGQFPVGMNLEVNYGGLQGQGSMFFGSDPKHPLPKPLNKSLKLPLVLRSGGQLFACPADTGTSFVRPTAVKYYGTSYYPNPLLVGRNLWVPYGSPCQEAWTKLVGDPWGWPPTTGLLDNLRRDRVDNPSTLLFMGDFTWNDNWDEGVPDEFPFWHARKTRQNIYFLDGHGEFVYIRKGISVDARYSIIPFRSSRERFQACQQEIKCP